MLTRSIGREQAPPLRAAVEGKGQLMESNRNETQFT